MCQTSEKKQGFIFALVLIKDGQRFVVRHRRWLLVFCDKGRAIFATARDVPSRLKGVAKDPGLPSIWSCPLSRLQKNQRQSGGPEIPVPLAHGEGTTRGCSFSQWGWTGACLWPCGFPIPVSSPAAHLPALAFARPLSQIPSSGSRTTHPPPTCHPLTIHLSVTHLPPATHS